MASWVENTRVVLNGVISIVLQIFDSWECFLKEKQRQELEWFNRRRPKSWNMCISAEFLTRSVARRLCNGCWVISITAWCSFGHVSL